MALFGRNKQQQPRKAKSGGGLLSAIGLKTEAVPTNREAVDAERNKNIVLAWQYLRGRIDKAVYEYYRTGKFLELERYVERPALDALKQELHELRSDNLLWQQPDRKTETHPEFTVVHVETNKHGQPISFVVRERFRDFAMHSRVVDSQLVPEARANGEEKVIEATVSVRDGSNYKLHSVRLAHEATLS